MMILRAALFVALSATTAPALERSVEACTQVGTSFVQLLAELSEIGWAVTTAPSEQQLEHVAWMLAAIYLETDSAGQSVESILELERPMARGLLRKKDIPTVRARLMDREVNGAVETVYMVVRHPNAGITEVQCRFALTAHSVTTYEAENARGAFELRAPITSSLGPVIRASGLMLSYDGAPDAIVESQMSFREGDAK